MKTERYSWYRHKKSGTDYLIRAIAKLQTAMPIKDNTELVIYHDEEGNYYARPTEEFEDGRFEPLPIGKIVGRGDDTGPREDDS